MGWSPSLFTIAVLAVIPLLPLFSSTSPASAVSVGSRLSSRDVANNTSSSTLYDLRNPNLRNLAHLFDSSLWNNCPVNIYWRGITGPPLLNPNDTDSTAPNNGSVSLPAYDKWVNLPLTVPLGQGDSTVQLSLVPNSTAAIVQNSTEVINFTATNNVIGYAFDRRFTSPYWPGTSVSTSTGLDEVGTVVTAHHCDLSDGCLPLSPDSMYGTLRNSSSCSAFCEFWIYTCVTARMLPGTYFMTYGPDVSKLGLATGKKGGRVASSRK